MAQKATIRNYMELLRDLSNSKGRVAVSKYATKHHVSQAVTVSLGKLGYISSRGGPSGSVWVGPHIGSEDELRTYADRVMKTSNKYNLDSLRNRTAEKRNDSGVVSYDRQIKWADAKMNPLDRAFLNALPSPSFNAELKANDDGSTCSVILTPRKNKPAPAAIPAKSVGIIRRFLRWIY